MREDEERAARQALARALDHELGPFAPAHLDAIVEVERARFIRPIDRARAYEDVPLPLDDEGLATISAPHAYLLSFRLLELAEGDHVVELGSGSGYGAALAAQIVGDTGHVTTIEIDPILARRAATLLAGRTNVTCHEADAIESTELWRGARKIVCTFAVDEIPKRWLVALAALPVGGILVAPVGREKAGQRLLRIVHGPDGPHATDHGGVRYVANRGSRP
jgi:protein-L-isoaspartate(D-aspartate) O-methyltransferase